MNTTRIKQLFIELAKEIASLTLNQEPMQSGPVTGPLLIRGGLILRGEIVDEYLLTLDKITKLAETDRTWSKSAVDDALAECLLGVVSGASNASQVISEQATIFIGLFKHEPSTWEVALAVFGLAPDCTGYQFGQITFGRQSYKPALSITNLLEKDKEVEILWAEIKINAIDRATAILRATEVIDQHLAILNALCSDGRPSSIRIRRNLGNQGFEVALSRTNAASHQEETTQHSSKTSRNLNRAELETKLNRRAGEQIGAHLKRKTEFSEQLMAAYGFTGSAELESQKHTAFMLYAIALESVILGKNTKTELSLQLSIRVAHLLFNGVEGRRQMLERIKELYDIRSKIVHTGSTEVTDSQLEELRQITLISLHILASNQQFSEYATRKELDDWFVGRLLDSSSKL